MPPSGMNARPVVALTKATVMMPATEGALVIVEKLATAGSRNTMHQYSERQ
jgi:hypothetical protein